MNSELKQRFIPSKFTWLYWTGLCAIYVLLEDSGPNVTTTVCYSDAFGTHKTRNRWDTEGICRSVMHTQDGSCNIYSIPKESKSGDWFCVYDWEFAFD